MWWKLLTCLSIFINSGLKKAKKPLRKFVSVILRWALWHPEQLSLTSRIFEWSISGADSCCNLKRFSTAPNIIQLESTKWRLFGSPGLWLLVINDSIKVLKSPFEAHLCRMCRQWSFLAKWQLSLLSSLPLSLVYSSVFSAFLPYSLPFFSILQYSVQDDGSKSCL